MATPPVGGGAIPPGDLGGTPQTPATAPPNFSGMQNDINSMGTHLVELNTTMSTLVHTLERAYEKILQMGKGAEDLSTHFTEGVTAADRMRNGFKSVSAIAKELSLQARAQNLTYAQLEASLKQQLRTAQEVMAGQKKTSAEYIKMKDLVTALTQELKKVSAEGAKVGAGMKVTASDMKSIGDNAEKISKSFASMAQNAGKIEMGRLEKHARTLNTHYREAGVHVKLLSHLEDWADQRRAMRDLGAARRAHQEETRAAFREKLKSVAPHLATVGGVQLPYDKKGNIDFAALAKRKPVTGAAEGAIIGAPYADIGRRLAVRGGTGPVGGFDAWLSGKAERARQMAAGGLEQPGMIGRLGMKLADAGGGSVLGGVAEGGLGSALPAVAAGEAVYKVVTGFIDKMAITNQAIEKGMGGALFQPGMTGGAALNAVRQNLSAPGIYNAYGQTLERNLGIAQAMQEGGLDVTELTRPQQQTGEGFLKGAYGEFQQTAYKTGRGIGLTDQQTVQRMTKLVYEMRQTFGATEDFLATVGTQARAAGISTTKYLSIVDDLVGHFDKMNKSFNETVSILQTLGATGSRTAEELKDLSDSFTGAGEQKNKQQKAYAFMRIQQEYPELGRAAEETQAGYVDKAVQSLRDELSTRGGLTIDTVKGMQMKTPKDLLRVQERIDQLPIDPKYKQALTEARELAQAQMEQGIGLHMGFTGGAAGAIGASFREDVYGEGAVGKAVKQQALLRDLLKRSKMSPAQLLEHPEKLATLAAGMAPEYGLKPEDLQKFPELLTQVGDTRVKNATGELDPGKRTRAYREFFKMGQVVKAFPKIGSEMNDATFLKNMDSILENPDNRNKLADAIQEHLADNDGEFLKAFFEQQTKLDKDKQAKADDQVRDVAMQTRTTGDIFASAFEYLFKSLVQSLDDIKDLVYKITWHFDKNPSGTVGGNADLLGALTGAQATGLIDATIKAAYKVMSDPNSNQATRNKAQQDIDTLKAFGLGDMTKKTVQVGQDVLDLVHGYESTRARLDLADVGDADPLHPDRNKYSGTTLDEAAIRALSQQGIGGQFDPTGKRLMLGKNLSADQLAAIQGMQTALGPDIFRLTKDAQGRQYIQITMNSTDIVAFMQRFGAELHNLGIGKSGETTHGGAGVTGSTSASKHPTPVSMGMR